MALLRDGLRLNTGSEWGMVKQGALLKCPHEISRDLRGETPLGPHCAHSEADIRLAYPDVDEQPQDAIVLVLKLGLALAAYGQDTTHTEDVMTKCAVVLGVPLDLVSVDPRELRASFKGHASVHQLAHSEGLINDKASDIYTLSICIAAGEVPDVLRACEIIDAISVRKPAHGWLVSQLCALLFPSLVCASCFGGDWIDSGVCLVVSVALMFVEKLCQLVKTLSGVKEVFVPATVGLLLPLISGRYLGRDACHYPSMYMSLLLLHVPGLQLIRAAYEIIHGSKSNGGSRMVSAVVSEMFLALVLTAAWQVFASDEDYAAPPSKYLVPTEKCVAPFEWWFAFGVLSVPVVICLAILLNTRLGDIPLVIVLGSGSLLLLVHLSVSFPWLPSYVVNFLTFFCASFIAMAHQYRTGATWFVSLTNTICLLAPGAAALLQTLIGLGAHESGAASFAAWFDMLMQGVTYATGLHFAEQLWKVPLETQAHFRMGESSLSPEAKQSLKIKLEHLNSHRTAHFGAHELSEARRRA